MPLILDTDTVPPAERAERLREVLRATSNASTVDLVVDRGAPTGHVEYTDLGRTALFTNASSGTRLSLSARDADQADDTIVAIAVQLAGTQLQRSSSGESVVRPGDLLVVDYTHGFDVRWSDLTKVSAFKVPRDVLDLSVDDVRRAAGQLTSSSLYPLVRRHLAELARLPETLLQGDAGVEISAATVHLTRALLMDARDAGASTRGVAEASLMTQVHVYVRQHLRDADLGAEQVATALNISRRTLYRLLARQGLRLEQYIISERLQAARLELEMGDPRLTIARIAHRFGFKDARHFSRRFKAQFGMVPQEFRTQFGA